jgi:hypothetical protein
MSSLEIAHKQRIPVKNNGPRDPIQAIHLFDFKVRNPGSIHGIPTDIQFLLAITSHKPQFKQ